MTPAPLIKQTSFSNHVSIVYAPPSENSLAREKQELYLQVGSLQPAVHVLLPRERQLSLRWTGHRVHASGGNAPRSQCVGKVETDWARCWLPLGASRRLKGPRTAANEAPGVVHRSFIAVSSLAPPVVHFKNVPPCGEMIKSGLRKLWGNVSLRKFRLFSAKF